MTGEKTYASWVEQAASTRLGKDGTEKEIKTYQSIVMFSLGRESYGVPIGEVKEVVAVPYITPLPQTEDHLLGVGNIRGNVIAIIDVAHRIAGTPTDRSQGFVIILKDKDLKVGFLVSQVPNTILVETGQINKSAAVLKSLGEKDDYVVGVCKHEDKMIFMVDLRKMV